VYSPDCCRQRAGNIDLYVRQSRLQAFIEPIRLAWQNEDFRRICSSFGGFCELLGFGGVGPYMQAKNAHRIEDWSAIALDDEGKLLQETMTTKFQVRDKRPNMENY
jgi:exportin-5